MFSKKAKFTPLKLPQNIDGENVWPIDIHKQKFWIFIVFTTKLLSFLLSDTMDLHMSSLGTLVLQGLCGVFYATRHQFAEV